jgi:hypothetical protein
MPRGCRNIVMRPHLTFPTLLVACVLSSSCEVPGNKPLVGGKWGRISQDSVLSILFSTLDDHLTRTQQFSTFRTSESRIDTVYRMPIEFYKDIEPLSDVGIQLGISRRELFELLGQPARPAVNTRGVSYRLKRNWGGCTSILFLINSADRVEYVVYYSRYVCIDGEGGKS